MLDINEVVYVKGIVVKYYDDPRYGEMAIVNVSSALGDAYPVHLREDEITKIPVVSEEEKEEIPLHSVDVLNEDGEWTYFIKVVDIHTWNEFTVLEFHNGGEIYIKTSTISRLEKRKYEEE